MLAEPLNNQFTMITTEETTEKKTAVPPPPSQHQNWPLMGVHTPTKVYSGHRDDPNRLTTVSFLLGRKLPSRL